MIGKDKGGRLPAQNHRVAELGRDVLRLFSPNTAQSRVSYSRFHQFVCEDATGDSAISLAKDNTYCSLLIYQTSNLIELVKHGFSLNKSMLITPFL